MVYNNPHATSLLQSVSPEQQAIDDENNSHQHQVGEVLLELPLVTGHNRRYDPPKAKGYSAPPEFNQVIQLTQDNFHETPLF